MKGLDAFRWLMPVALVVLLSVPVQTANPRGMGGGGGHMGRTGGGHMGGRGRMGGMGGLRGHPAMESHFFSRTGASRFGPHQNLASRNHNFGRFAGRSDRFANRDRFGNERFGREGRFEGRGLGGWGAWGWGGWGGPWWWGWGGYPYYGDYGYYQYYDDPQGYGSQDNGSQYGAEYWNNLAMSVQTKLADQGYYLGRIDGVIGSGTIEAVRQFQADHGLQRTGKIDPDLLNALGINSEAQS
jgi:Putative peptidoglycan binding domain